jgi:hydroxymethylbilane synthase
MKMTSRITALLSSEPSKGGMFHAVGQGAIAIEIRSRDDRVKNVLRGAGHWQSEWRVGAERALLRELEGGCSVPVGVETVLKEITAEDPAPSSLRSPFEDNSAFQPVDESSPLIHHSGAGRSASIDLAVCVTSMDGVEQVIHRPGSVRISSFQEAQAWGKQVAVEIKQLGAEKILAEINAIRREREAEAAKAGKETADPDGHAIPA